MPILIPHSAFSPVGTAEQSSTANQVQDNGLAKKLPTGLGILDSQYHESDIHRALLPALTDRIGSNKSCASRNMQPIGPLSLDFPFEQRAIVLGIHIILSCITFFSRS